MEQAAGPTLDHAIPTLALAQFVATGGPFPPRGDTDGSSLYFGMIQASATRNGYGAPRAQGQLLPISGATPLFSILGTDFGGNGRDTFALPDLRGRAATGGDPGEQTDRSLTMTYMIAAKGSTTGMPPVGTVALFCGHFVPGGWAACDGSQLPLSEYPQLYSVIGTTFGGDGESFALPDLAGRAVCGTGAGPSRPAVALGEKVEGVVQGLGLNYLICTDGDFPTSDGRGEFPTDRPFMGQIIAYAGNDVPTNWAWCDGSLLQVNRNRALFALLGTSFGGDGQTRFGLPDLRGRIIVGD